jgi:hypothetical protein
MGSCKLFCLVSAYHVAWDDRLVPPCPAVVWGEVLWATCPDWPQIVILSISASQIAWITGWSHWHLACISFLPPPTFFFFFGGIRVWTQVLYHLNHASSTFCSVYFGGVGVWGFCRLFAQMGLRLWSSPSQAPK